jgi:hypothetical protein
MRAHPPSQTIANHIIPLTTLVHARNATRPREKEGRQVLLPGLNDDVASWIVSLQSCHADTEIVFNLVEFALTACQPRSR